MIGNRGVKIAVREIKTITVCGLSYAPPLSASAKPEYWNTTLLQRAMVRASHDQVEVKFMSGKDDGQDISINLPLNQWKLIAEAVADEGRLCRSE